jgi:hypothetical protein
LVFRTFNIASPLERLERAVLVLTQPISKDSSYEHIDEVQLNNIVINEFSKSYLTKEVDTENKEGYFSVFKRLITRMKEMIVEINPEYAYPSSLASTVLETSLYQSFLKDHFPSITDCSSSEETKNFLVHMITNTLKKK